MDRITSDFPDTDVMTSQLIHPGWVLILYHLGGELLSLSCSLGALRICVPQQASSQWKSCAILLSLVILASAQDSEPHAGDTSSHRLIPARGLWGCHDGSISNQNSPPLSDLGTHSTVEKPNPVHALMLSFQGHLCLPLRHEYSPQIGSRRIFCGVASRNSKLNKYLF